MKIIIAGLLAFLSGCAGNYMWIDDSTDLLADVDENGVLVINEMLGGFTPAMVDNLKSLKSHNATVQVRGLCDSACTMLLETSALPLLCVEPEATFRFHQAWYCKTGRYPCKDTDVVPDTESTRIIFDRLDSRVQNMLPPPETWTIEYTKKRTIYGYELVWEGVVRECPLQ